MHNSVPFIISKIFLEGFIDFFHLKGRYSERKGKTQREKVSMSGCEARAKLMERQQSEVNSRPPPSSPHPVTLQINFIVHTWFLAFHFSKLNQLSFSGNLFPPFLLKFPEGVLVT